MSTNGKTLSRRHAVAGLGAALALPAVIEARGQTGWTNKPVKLIVPYAPGGAADSLARPWAEKLSQAFGMPFVIDNKGGASGTIGAEAAARSAPDGTSFLFTPNSALNVVPQLRKVNYEARKDLMPVARVGDIVGGFVIVQQLGIKSMPELIAYAKQNPGKVAYGSAGLGTSTQMRIETLKLRAGIDILHVPYRGSADALVDLLSGSIQMMNEVVVYPHVKSGKLNLLAINNPTRHWDFPDVPTMTEAGFPNADVPIWFSVWAPTGTSKEIVEVFNQKVMQIAKAPEMVQKLRELSFTVIPLTPQALMAFFDEDWQANSVVIKEAKITLS